MEINSTIHRNGIRYQGLFKGRREEGNLYLTHWTKIPVIQQDKDAPKLNLNVVVTGYL